MGLLEQELKELAQLRSDLSSGKKTVQQVNAEVGIFSQTEKRMSLMVKMHALSSNTSTKKLMIASNLIGDKEAIDIGSLPDNEMVICPDLERTISRSECYERSGSIDHSEGCGSCKNKKITYSKLDQ